MSRFSELARRLEDLYLLLSGRHATQFKRSFVETRSRLDALERLVEQYKLVPNNKNIYVPKLNYQDSPPDWPFMEYSTCSAKDFFHPRCAEIASLFNSRVSFHRKFWEHIYIINSAILSGCGPSKTALGFGVGKEVIPAVLAKLGATVTATDGPPEIGTTWSLNDEFASNHAKLFYQGIIEESEFNRLVYFSICDMNNIEPNLNEFDFCWSSCCLEHLGSLQHGIDFIINSVERTLKVGGTACHTTELNLSYDEHTIESGGTVLYRKKDLEALVLQLRERGHSVQNLRIAPDTHYLDGYVDTPPYDHSPHLKLLLDGFVTTSVGLTITRGR